MKRSVSTNNAPKAIGPYNQAIISNGFVFLSGQIPLVPSTGEIVGNSITEQAHQVLKNLGAVLEASGCSFDDVVKTTCYLKSMNEFPLLNDVYSQYFRNNPPARATVEVSRLPKDVLVEIDAIAVLPHV